jgi:RNA polymerase sigma-70 factor (ECF subfamily)
MNHDTRVSDDEFQAWVAPLLERAAGYAWAIVRNREDAEDALQEALVRAYRALSRYDRSRSFKGWLFAIVRHCCLDLLRRRGTRPVFVAMDPADLSLATRDNSPERERRDTLEWALAQLSPAHRKVIELRYFGDCSYREIAEALGIPEGTVMSRLHAARQALTAIHRKEPS